MPKVPLPVFQIQDFETQPPEAPAFYLNSVSRHLQKHHFIQKPHKHDFYIVLFVSRGSGTHRIDFIDYPVGPGSVFFLSPGQVHSWDLSADADGYICFFSEALYRFGFPERRLRSYLFFHPLLAPMLQLQLQEAEETASAFVLLQREHANPQWRSEDLIRNLLDTLLIRLARVYRQQHPEALPTSGHFNLLVQLEELIEQHYRAHLPVSFYAEMLHVTQKQLNDQCRQSLGKTTSDLIQDRMILEARRLLVHSGLTITQLAAELGYFDNSYFTRFFRKKTGETPEQFRARFS